MARGSFFSLFFCSYGSVSLCLTHTRYIFCADLFEAYLISIPAMDSVHLGYGAHEGSTGKSRPPVVHQYIPPLWLAEGGYCTRSAAP